MVASTSGLERQPTSIPAIADRVATLVRQKFEQLTTDFRQTYAKRKVLAGVVMTSRAREESAGDAEDARVVCLATGTKCVNGEYMSVSGLVINDCHAEVLARRCLRKFLFQQLLRSTRSQTETDADVIFERADDDTGGYRLRSDVRFHLYISTSPCGDARIFSPHEVTSLEPDPHPRRKARGLLRTKIDLSLYSTSG